MGQRRARGREKKYRWMVTVGGEIKKEGESRIEEREGGREGGRREGGRACNQV